MGVGYAIFFSVIIAFGLMLIIGFWIDKLGGGMTLGGYAIAYLASAVVAFCFLRFAPPNILVIASCIAVGILVLTLIVNSISR